MTLTRRSLFGLVLAAFLPKPSMHVGRDSLLLMCDGHHWHVLPQRKMRVRVRLTREALDHDWKTL